MRLDDTIANIKQNGRRVGAILANQTIQWDAALQNDAIGAESDIDKILKFQSDAVDSTAAVSAVTNLHEAFAGTSVEFVLVVDQLYGTDPDVIS